jgi:hypothetical protein
VRRASLVLLVLAVAAGCGGGGGKRLSRQEFASKADAICSGYNRELTALKQPSSVAELGTSLDHLLVSFERARKDLSRLKPPENEQATVDQWLAQLEILEGDLKAVRDKAKSNDVPGVQAAGRKGVEDNRRRNRLAAKLGMTVCSQG